MYSSPSILESAKLQRAAGLWEEERTCFDSRDSFKCWGIQLGGFVGNVCAVYHSFVMYLHTESQCGLRERQHCDSSDFLQRLKNREECRRIPWTSILQTNWPRNNIPFFFNRYSHFHGNSTPILKSAVKLMHNVISDADSCPSLGKDHPLIPRGKKPQIEMTQ